MRDRILILSNVLREDGSIWISLDDNELHFCRLICEEVFGKGNFVTTIVWEKRTTRENRSPFSTNHDYVIVFAKNYSQFVQKRNLLPLTDETKKRYQNPDNDIRGPWQSISATAQAESNERRKSQIYEIVTPTGKKYWPPAGSCWRYTQEKMKAEINLGNVYFPRNGDGVPRIKKFFSELDQEGLVPETLWLAKNSGTTDSAKRHTMDVCTEADSIFATPKPEELLFQIFQIATNKNEIILDCFAGSGTALAVAQKLRRRWIGVEVGNHSNTHIIPRLKKVLSGQDQGGISGAINWKGGGSFRYCGVGPSILVLEADGNADFRWELGREELEKSLLLSYDFRDLKTLANATVGHFGPLVGIASLAPPGTNTEILPELELQQYIADYLSHSGSMVFYTNRGVEIALSEKPKNLEIIKVPQALIAQDQ